MRNLIVVIIVSVFLGCATQYKSIENRKPYQIVIESDENIEVSFGDRNFSNNNRMQKRANNKNIILKEIVIKNISGSIINIEYNKMYLDNRGSRILPLEVDEIYNNVKLSTLPYMFWGLLWVGYHRTDCSTGGCNTESHMYPVGLPIGIINMIMASSGNSAMKKELSALNFKHCEIKPSETTASLPGNK